MTRFISATNLADLISKLIAYYAPEPIDLLAIDVTGNLAYGVHHAESGGFYQKGWIDFHDLTIVDYRHGQIGGVEQ